MNQKAAMLWALFWAALSLVYGIFLLIYLNDTGKYKNQMSTRDKRFRQAAIIITWIEIVLTGLGCIGLLIGILAGGKEYGGYNALEMASPATMGWY